MTYGMIFLMTVRAISSSPLAGRTGFSNFFAVHGSHERMVGKGASTGPTGEAADTETDEADDTSSLAALLATVSTAAAGLSEARAAAAPRLRAAVMAGERLRRPNVPTWQVELESCGVLCNQW